MALEPVTGDEVDLANTVRRIDRNLQGPARSGIGPKSLDPYFGLIHQNSPLGEIIGAGADTLSRVGDVAAATYEETRPTRMIENYLGAGIGMGEKLGNAAMDIARWSIAPRGSHKPAAFGPKGVYEPRSYPGAEAPPPPPSKPITSGAVDAASRATGVDSSKVPPQSTTLPGEHGTLRVKVGGQWVDWNPENPTDVGAPGAGGFVQPDVESMPPVQRPDSYYENAQEQRAIERARLAPGWFGDQGFTLGEAIPFMGQQAVNRAAADREIAVYGARNRMDRESEDEFVQKHEQVNRDYFAAKNAIEAAFAGRQLTPAETLDMNRRLNELEDRYDKTIKGLHAGAPGTARGTRPGAFYDPRQ